MQCQKIAEKLKQNLPSVSTERREAQPLREERDPFTFLRIAAVNIREAREDLKYIGCYHACRNGAMEILYHAVRQDAPSTPSPDSHCLKLSAGLYWYHSSRLSAKSDS